MTLRLRSSTSAAVNHGDGSPPTRRTEASGEAAIMRVHRSGSAARASSARGRFAAPFFDAPGLAALGGFGCFASLRCCLATAEC